MIQIIGEMSLMIPATVIQWAPTKWNERQAWGPEAQDGFYVTQAGEIYRLCGRLVVYVSEMEKH